MQCSGANEVDEERLERLLEHLGNKNPTALLWDDCDDALIGIATNVHGTRTVACYSMHKFVRCMMANQELTTRQAMEWMLYNCFDVEEENNPVFLDMPLDGVATRSEFDARFDAEFDEQTN